MPNKKITLAETHKKKMVRDKNLHQGPHAFETTENFFTTEHLATMDLKRAKDNAKSKKELNKALNTGYETTSYPLKVAKQESQLRNRKSELHDEAIKRDSSIRENLQVTKLVNDLTSYLKSLHVEPADSHEAVVLKTFVNKFVSHTKDFVTPHPKEPLRGKLTYEEYVTLTEGALKNFKKEMKHALTRTPHSIVEKVSDVIRKFLHVFDVLFSKVTGKPTAAETHTFGAKTLTGKDHFFNKPESLFGKKVEAFHEAIKKAETPKHGAPKFHG